jgi:hypothetical protein
MLQILLSNISLLCSFLACFHYYEWMKVCLCDEHAVCVSIYPPINISMPEPICMKDGMFIMTRDFILTEYFINPSHKPVCLYVYPPIVTRQRLGKKVTAAKNTHATVEELFGASLSMRSLSYQRKVGHWFFPELLVQHFLLVFGKSCFHFSIWRLGILHDTFNNFAQLLSDKCFGVYLSKKRGLHPSLPFLIHRSYLSSHLKINALDRVQNTAAKFSQDRNVCSVQSVHGRTGLGGYWW